MIHDCLFDRLDGNGVMVSGYNRNATVQVCSAISPHTLLCASAGGVALVARDHDAVVVQMSEFNYIGGNAVAAWGYTNETATDPGRPGVAITGYPAAGVDGTDGEHPRYTTVLSNVIHEVGLYEKQSSFFVEAKTAQSIIKGNVS